MAEFWCFHFFNFRNIDSNLDFDGLNVLFFQYCDIFYVHHNHEWNNDVFVIIVTQLLLLLILEFPSCMSIVEIFIVFIDIRIMIYLISEWLIWYSFSLLCKSKKKGCIKLELTRLCDIFSYKILIISETLLRKWMPSPCLRACPFCQFTNVLIKKIKDLK